MQVLNLNTKVKKIEIVGIPSGDHEAFCFDVSREEYIRIKGSKPYAYDKGFSKNTYRIYPDFNLYPSYIEDKPNPESKKRIKATIILEEVD